MRTRLLLLAVLVLAVPTATLAQEKGNVGLTMGYPGSIGIVWHASERLALRPELTVARTSTDVSSQPAADNAGWSLGVGLSAIFYVTKADNLRTYISPRYVYSRSSTTITTPSVLLPATNELTNSGASVAGSYGAQYSISPRFSAFGEVGFSYTRQTVRSSLSSFRSTLHAWGTRTGAGFILYF